MELGETAALVPTSPPILEQPSLAHRLPLFRRTRCASWFILCFRPRFLTQLAPTSSTTALSLRDSVKLLVLGLSTDFRIKRLIQNTWLGIVSLCAKNRQLFGDLGGSDNLQVSPHHFEHRDHASGDEVHRICIPDSMNQVLQTVPRFTSERTSIPRGSGHQPTLNIVCVGWQPLRDTGSMNSGGTVAILRPKVQRQRWRNALKSRPTHTRCSASKTQTSCYRFSLGKAGKAGRTLGEIRWAPVDGPGFRPEH